MKSKLLALTISSLVLASGCAAPGGSFQDIAEPILFGRMDTVDWLAVNDEELLRQIVTHNEQVAALAK